MKLHLNTERAKARGFFMALNMRPFSVVMMYQVNRISAKMLPKLYEDLKAKLREDLSSAKFIALATDGWTSRTTESFITRCVWKSHKWPSVRNTTGSCIRVKDRKTKTSPFPWQRTAAKILFFFSKHLVFPAHSKPSIVEGHRHKPVVTCFRKGEKSHLAIRARLLQDYCGINETGLEIKFCLLL